MSYRIPEEDPAYPYLRGRSYVFADALAAIAFTMTGRLREAEDVLLGKAPSGGLCRQAAEKVSAEMIARTGYRWSTEYKKPVAEALTVRALRKVLEE